jgi:type I restriction enzyme S subunit
MTSGATRHDWRARRLDQLGFVGRGRSRHRPRNDPSLYGGPYPFFQTGDIKAANLYAHEHTQTYNEKGLKQSKLWEPGTLCITIAANIAETAILPVHGCFPDSVVGFIANPREADVRFIKYCFDILQLRMQAVSRGTTQDNLSLDKLLGFEFLVPEVEVQRRIADILSAYDNLIENNSRRIALLEEVARTLYREWFVHFRFPGHERVRMVESPLGPIPEGWEAGRLDDALVLQRGFDLPVQERRTGTVPVYAATGVVGRHDEARVRGPGVLTGRSGSLGKVMYVEEDFWPLNTTLWVKEFRRASPLYAFYLLSNLNLGGFNSGAAVPTLNRNDIHGLPVLLPPRRLLKILDQHLQPIWSLGRLLDAQITNLRMTRDFLLPKLISGEIDVAETADALEASA